MKIDLTYNGSNYSIVVEPQSFTAYKHGINSAKGKNFGEPTESIIGHFTNIASAVKKICQTELSNTDETVTLMEYAERVESAYTELMLQTQS